MMTNCGQEIALKMPPIDKDKEQIREEKNFSVKWGNAEIAFNGNVKFPSNEYSWKIFLKVLIYRNLVVLKKYAMFCEATSKTVSGNLPILCSL